MVAELTVREVALDNVRSISSQAIPYTTDVDDITRFLGVALNLAAQVVDMPFDELPCLSRVRLVASSLAEQLLGGNYGWRTVRQRHQQVKFGRRQVQLSLIYPGQVTLQVNFKGATGQQTWIASQR